MRQLLTVDQIAKIAREATLAALNNQQTIQDAIDDDQPSNIEIWAAHFVDHCLIQDPLINDAMTRHDTTTALFEQQLEALLARTYDRRYPGLIARTLVDQAPGIPTGAEVVASIGYDHVGEATILASYGEDVRRVDLDGIKNTWNIVGIAASWMLTIQQARAATMAGVDLDNKGLMAARRIVETEVDEIISLGRADNGILGILTQATGAGNVPLNTAGGTITGGWHAAATAANILADFSVMWRDITTSHVWRPTDLGVDSDSYARMIALPFNSFSDMTVAEFIETKYGVTIHEWWRCDLANAGGTAPRVVLYQRDPEIMEAVVSQEPEMLPSYWSGLGWETVMHARCGGTKLENPTGMSYGDLA